MAQQGGTNPKKFKAAPSEEIKEGQLYTIINPSQDILWRLNSLERKWIPPFFYIYERYVGDSDYDSAVYLDGSYSEDFCEGTFRKVSILPQKIEVHELYNKDIELTLGVPFVQEHQGDRISHTELFMRYKIKKNGTRTYLEEGMGNFRYWRDTLVNLINNGVAEFKTDVDEMKGKLEGKIKHFLEPKGIEIMIMDFMNVLSPTYITMKRKAADLKMIQEAFPELKALYDPNQRFPDKILVSSVMEKYLGYILEGKPISSAEEEELKTMKAKLLEAGIKAESSPVLGGLRILFETLQKPEATDRLERVLSLIFQKDKGEKQIAK